MDIWLFDLLRGTSTRLTVLPTANGYPVWSPDGLQIAFSSRRDGGDNLYSNDANGAGEGKLLLKTQENKWPTAWSPDGRWLLYNEHSPKTQSDLWVLALDGHQPTLWLGGEFEERNGRFSPDGQLGGLRIR